jgi:outer membrane lipoprotein carrier protein
MIKSRMTNRILSLAAAFAVAAAIPCALAGPREDIARYTQGLKGLDGHFVQRVFNSSGALKEESSGRVSLSAPRQFRWEYQRPNPQLIVADGDHVWIYDPDLEQVTVKNQNAEEQQSALTVLIDPGELDRRYLLGDAGNDGGLKWISLKPKKPSEDSQFKQAKLGFNAVGLDHMTIEDTLGQRTEIVFTDWQRNPTFSKGLFSFTPPKGVDVVGDTSQPAEVHPLKN